MKPSAWTAFWRSVVRFQTDKINPWIALRNTIGLVAPMAVFAAMGETVGGVAMSTGALNVSFRDSTAPYIQRARLMLAASLVAGLAAFAGGLSGRHPASAVAVSGVWAFVAGMLVAVSPMAADLGVLSLVMLLVYSSNPRAIANPELSGLLALSGGLIQTLLAVSFWPLRRYVPERRSLADLLVALAGAAENPGSVPAAPPASAQSTAAQTAIAALEGDRSNEGVRYRSLLSQAERMRLSLLALMRLRGQLEKEAPGDAAIEILDRFFNAFSPELRSAAATLNADGGRPPAERSLGDLDALAEQLRNLESGGTPLVLALRNEARAQMDALAGQLRSAIDLTRETDLDTDDVEVPEPSRPKGGRELWGKLVTMRANLNFGSAAFRHGLRLAACIALGDALARGFGLQRSYWLPMTIAIVLKPDFAATFSRGALRLAGTFGGLLFATGLFHMLSASVWAQIAAIAVLMFLLRWFGPGNYGVLVTGVTALVVLLIAMTGIPPKEVIAARAFNTAAGGAIALLAYWLWPTWERTQFPEMAARLLEAYRRYFHAVWTAYLERGTRTADELEQARVAGRMVRTNFEASIERLRAEPGTPSERIALLGAILAGARRLAQALLSLEAGLYSKRPSPPRETFLTFARDVETTFGALAEALRGSAKALASLPNLREDHHALVHSGDSRNEVYALVNVETDRITNSLNTLGEDLSRWISSDAAEIR